MIERIHVITKKSKNITFLFWYWLLRIKAVTLNTGIVIPFLLIGIALAGCSRVEKKVETPNVLFISVDTLRKDHLRRYGYERQTSPNIDRLARHGVVFDNVISTSSWTLPAHASMLTGRYPAFHGLQDDGVKLAKNIPTLAEYFRDRGYDTRAVVSHIYVSSIFGLDRGFNVFDDSLIAGGARNPIAEEVVDNFLEMADTRPTKKYFGFIHFFDPHYSYKAPPPFYSQFADPVYRGDVDGAHTSMLKYFGKDQIMPETDLKQLIAYYDGEIAYVDSQIGRLLKEMEKRGMLNNAVIIITSDHGEEFKEHGQLGHGRTLFGEQLRVPLIIAGYPEVKAGSRRNDLVSLTDLTPTLLDLIGEENLQNFLGRPVFQDHKAGGRSVIAESIRFGFEMRAIRQEQYKLIHDRNSDLRYFYDLDLDPFETLPLESDPTGGELQSELADYTSIADSGWHLKLIGWNSDHFRLKASINTSGRFENPRYYFSKDIAGAHAAFLAFELSPDSKILTFDVVVSNHLSEIVFKTEPPDSQITITVETTSSDNGSGLFLGKGVRISDDKPITLTRTDPRVEGMPKNYTEAETGLYIYSVKSVAESAPKTKISKEAIEKLRSLGYIQ